MPRRNSTRRQSELLRHDPTDVVSVATLFDGFEQAFARWQKVERAPQDLARTFIPLYEVLEWTACIDDRLKTKTWIRAPHLRGLRWARHRCHHDWAMALEVRSWDQWKLGTNMVREPGAPDEWAWRERLPDAKRARFREDEPFYESHLAGQCARVTLNLIRAFSSNSDRAIPRGNWASSSPVRGKLLTGLQLAVQRGVRRDRRPACRGLGGLGAASLPRTFHAWNIWIHVSTRSGTILTLKSTDEHTPHAASYQGCSFSSSSRGSSSTSGRNALQLSHHASFTPWMLRL
jgi:hypothetical protein